MLNILVVAGISIVLAILGVISGFCGWELLEDKRWFWRIHQDKKIRKTILILLLSTIGIPYVWGFIMLGTTMLIIVETYELVRYGQTTGYD